LSNPKKPRKPLQGWGYRIYEARTAMRKRTGGKMSQQELGDLVGVSDSMIGYYESETSKPDYETWVKIAEVLGTDPAWLYFGVRTMEDERIDIPAEVKRRKRKG
jgi:transcriptional regulator with XRE-family HTH domain